MDMLCQARKRTKMGDFLYKSLADKLENLSQDELERVRYHRNCRKHVIGRRRQDDSPVPTTSSLQIPVPAKRGRPSLSSRDERSKRTKGIYPKEKVCVFAPCRWEGQDQLHLVTTDNRGNELLAIKNTTSSDHVRACLSSLVQDGDAAAQEKWYHSNCLRDAHRSCPSATDSDSKHPLLMRIVDLEFIMSVKTALSEKGAILTMAEINNEYLSLQDKHSVPKRIDASSKQYVKRLLLDNIEGISFVQPPQRNKCENVTLSKTVGSAVEEFVIRQDSNDLLINILHVAHSLRKELLTDRNAWKFSGALDNFHNPVLTEFFITQILFGPHSRSVTGKRNLDVQNTVDIVCQVLVQNVKSDKQIRYQPKSDVGFVQYVETPLSLGLPLNIHQRVRDKKLVNFVSDLYLGTAYPGLLNFEKRIESAVVSRMNTSGGYCIPSFVKKGKTLFFALDNIDHLACTAYGANTFHGLIIVLNQEEDQTGIPVNGPLEIPDKPIPHQITVSYIDPPPILLTAVKFNSY